MASMKGSLSPRPMSVSTLAGCFIRMWTIWMASFFLGRRLLLRAATTPSAWALLAMVSLAASVSAVISSQRLAYLRI